jgi:hypothetical protein
MVFLSEQGRVTLSKTDLVAYARDRADEVEALCWSPRLKITDSEYQALALAKVRELVRALLHANGIFYDPFAPPIQPVQPPPPARAPPMESMPDHRPPTSPFGEVTSSTTSDDDDEPFCPFRPREFEKSEAFRFFNRTS